MRGQAHVVFVDQVAATTALRALGGETFYGKPLVSTHRLVQEDQGSSQGQGWSDNAQEGRAEANSRDIRATASPEPLSFCAEGVVQLGIGRCPRNCERCPTGVWATGSLQDDPCASSRLPPSLLIQRAPFPRPLSSEAVAVARCLVCPLPWLLLTLAPLRIPENYLLKNRLQSPHPRLSIHRPYKQQGRAFNCPAGG